MKSILLLSLLFVSSAFASSSAEFSLGERNTLKNFDCAIYNGNDLVENYEMESAREDAGSVFLDLLDQKFEMRRTHTSANIGDKASKASISYDDKERIVVTVTSGVVVRGGAHRYVKEESAYKLGPKSGCKLR